MDSLACTSIVVATLVTMIAIGVQAPDYVQKDITTHVSFQEAFLAVTNIIFAYSMVLPKLHIASYPFIQRN